MKEPRNEGRGRQERLEAIGRMVAATLALSGCGTHYLDHNAPGIAEIREPPKNLSPEAPHAVEVPADPGGHIVVLSYGLFAGVGGRAGPPGDVSYGLGTEVSLAKGITRSSRPDGFPYPLMEWGYGLNLGFTAIRALGKTVGPLYAEAEVRTSAFAFGAGWVWAPLDQTHGPQATLSFGPLFLRGTHEVALGTQIHVGILLKGYSAWAWSR